MDKLRVPRVSLPKLSVPSVSPIGHPDGEGYIKDGLVFWLDGIDKGGEEGKWVDKVGGVEFAPDGDAVWGPDYAAGVFVANQAVGYPHETSTIEIALRHKKRYTDTRLWFSAGMHGAIDIGVAGAYFVLITESPSTMQRTFRDVTLQGLGGQCISANQDRMMHNLEVDAQAMRNDYWRHRRDYAVLGGAQSLIDVEEYCSLRIYDRLLTEAEMRHNQKVDVKRFNLTFEQISTLEEFNEDLPELDGMGQ